MVPSNRKIDLSHFKLGEIEQAYSEMSSDLTDIHVWIHQVLSGRMDFEDFFLKVEDRLESSEMKSFISGCVWFSDRRDQNHARRAEIAM